MVKFFENLLSFFGVLWASENESWGALVLHLGTFGGFGSSRWSIGEALGLQVGVLERLGPPTWGPWEVLRSKLGACIGLQLQVGVSKPAFAEDMVLQTPT